MPWSRVFHSRYSRDPGRCDPVRLSFNVRALPVPIVNECATPREGESDIAKASSIFWCTAQLPIYAIGSIDVPSPEHQTRLLAMSRNFSNVSLPIEKIRVTEFDAPHPTPTDLSTPDGRRWRLPDSIDAVHGAIAMSIWAVPRVQPWIEVLRLALSGDIRGTVDATCQLGVPWLKLPWLVNESSASDQYQQDASDQPETQIARNPTSDEDDMDIRLWQAAITCTQHESQDRVSPLRLPRELQKELVPTPIKTGRSHGSMKRFVSSQRNNRFSVICLNAVARVWQSSWSYCDLNHETLILGPRVFRDCHQRYGGPQRLSAGGNMATNH